MSESLVVKVAAATVLRESLPQIDPSMPVLFDLIAILLLGLECPRMSKNGPSFAFCTLCSCDVSLAYGGTKDVRKHELTSLHQSA